MSGHEGRLIECLDHVSDENKVEEILAAHNIGSANRACSGTCPYGLEISVLASRTHELLGEA